jgi:hypothetical protein
VASTYSSNLGIELIGTGDQSGTWGSTTNTNLGTLIEQAISGYATQAVTTGADTTITIPNGSSGVARNMYIELTGSGGASTNLIVPANKKLYFIFNNTSSGQVTVKVSGQTGISVPNGKKMVLVSNGTDIVTAENYVASLSSDNLSLTGTLSVGSTSTFTGVATFTANPVLNGGTANGVLYLNGSKVATSGSALTFDGTNLGLVAAPSAWAGKAFQIGNASNSGWASIGYDANGKGFFSTSAYNSSGSSWTYTATGFAATLYSADSGSHKWFNAPSGTAGNAISFGDAKMTLDASGNLGIGTASPGAKLDVLVAPATAAAAGMQVRTASISAQLAITGATYNNYGVGANTVWLFSDTSNLALGPYAGTGSVQFVTGGFLRATLDQSGNFGLGITPNIGWASGRRVLQVSTGSGGAYLVSGSATQALLGANGYSDGTNFRYAAGGAATLFDQGAGVFNWLTAPSGTAGDVITFSTAMALDASGNLGLGVTPSAWSGIGPVLQVEQASLVSESNDQLYLTANAYFAGGAWNYIASDIATQYYQAAGAHVWRTAPSGTAGNAISFTQAMTLDSSGNLGIGTASPANKLDISGSDRIVRLNSTANNALIRYSTTGTARFSAGLNDPTGWIIYDDAAAAYRMVVDYSGNLGIGTTSPSTKLDVRSGYITSGTASSNLGTRVLAGFYTDGALSCWGTEYSSGGPVMGYAVWPSTLAADSFVSASGITIERGAYTISANNHRWYIGASQTVSIGSAVSMTQAMTLSAAGNLGVGTTTMNGRLNVKISGVDSKLVVEDGFTSTNVRLSAVNDAYTVYRSMELSGDTLRFITSSTERGRFTAGGYFKASDSGTYDSATGSYHEIRQTTNNATILISNTVASFTGTNIQSGVYGTVAGTGFSHIGCLNSAAATVFQVRGDGNAYNTNGTYGTISDERLKQDIVDADSQWDDIKAVRFRKYRMKADVEINPDTPAMFGLVAQELEQTSPGLVDELVDRDAEGNDLGTKTKSVKTSILLMKAAKALQEAMARIEQLEADMAALKGAK